MLTWHVQKWGTHCFCAVIQRWRVRAVSREHEAKTTFPAKAAKCRSMGRASVASAAHIAAGLQGAPAAPQNTSSSQILLFILCSPPTLKSVFGFHTLYTSDSLPHHIYSLGMWIKCFCPLCNGKTLICYSQFLKLHQSSFHQCEEWWISRFLHTFRFGSWIWNMQILVHCDSAVAVVAYHFLQAIILRWRFLA